MDWFSTSTRTSVPRDVAALGDSPCERAGARDAGGPHGRTSRGTAGLRGLTLLEVVLAVMLLSMTIGVVMSAVSSLAGNEAWNRKRLAGYEVANRILLQYLDDAKELPPKSKPIEYGPYTFFWDLDETRAVMAINRKQESGGANLQALDRFKLIGVSVFEADLVGEYERPGEVIAFLSRVIDPYAPRNPDSMSTYENNPDKIQEMIMGIVGGGSVGNGSARLQGRQLK